MKVQRQGEIRETEFTPKPWYVTGSAPDGTMIGSDSGTIANWPVYPKSNACANSSLIVAAPELFEALENARIALAFYREWMERDHPGTSYPFGMDCERDAEKLIDGIMEVSK